MSHTRVTTLSAAGAKALATWYPDEASGSGYCHLRGGGTSVVLRTSATTLPCVLHWGPDLGELVEANVASLGRALEPPAGDSVVYTQAAVAVLPEHSAGWLGRPGISGSRAGRSWTVSLNEVSHFAETAGSAAWRDGPEAAVRLRSIGTDATAQLRLSTELELHPSGLLRLRASVLNCGADEYEVLHIEPALPVPPEAVELLDMAGRHTHERVPQRRPFDVGGWVREARGGRPGHDSATVLCAGQAGFAFRSGRVWGVHLAWSGNQVLCAERAFNGWRLLRGGELLAPGEIFLAPGGDYTTPWLTASWGEGLDAMAGRFHAFVRARPNHPRHPRPVLINTWEAVYFDHDVDRLNALAERAAEVGVERFVLDDGWFRGRRDDRTGLGDWIVDETRWPQGLHPLVDRVHALGMEFGLWVEPEMVNLNSDLARDHPEWLFDAGKGPGVPSRNQHVLDLAHPAAWSHLLERLSALVTEYDIAYLKWDHNRPLVDAAHQPAGTPGVHEHTVALYRLLGALGERHPHLEIESCAGGGGRIDLGILDYTHRIWASDCIDPHERQDIQRWTSLLLPPELVGTHVGSPIDHTTQRAHPLGFRAGTALWGNLGIEWDLTSAAAKDIEELRRWVHLHAELRPLLHGGDVVHADIADPMLRVEGVVAPDQRMALYAVVVVGHLLTWPPGRVTLPGLHPDLNYRVAAQPPGDRYPGSPSLPPWLRDGLTLSGRVLSEVGIQAPALHPDHLVLIRVEVPEGAADSDGAARSSGYPA